jgi:hypothetical protein
MVPLSWFLWPYVESIGAVLGIAMAVLGWTAYLVYRATLPVRFRRFHDHDNTVEIRFRNDVYMHELSAAVRVTSSPTPSNGCSQPSERKA